MIHRQTEQIPQGSEPKHASSQVTHAHAAYGQGHLVQDPHSLTYEKQDWDESVLRRNTPFIKKSCLQCPAQKLQKHLLRCPFSLSLPQVGWDQGCPSHWVSSRVPGFEDAPFSWRLKGSHCPPLSLPSPSLVQVPAVSMAYHLSPGRAV